ncbi:MAG: zinc-binding alcohol dehydrogenase family protein [bacterium]|nr:zinc-binding alcohol dehydrogenase family protein [bacterium]
MRAALITEAGASPVVEERQLPDPSEGEVTVALEAASLNPVDLAIASGGFYAGHPPMPYVPAIEAVGRVEGDGRRVFVMGGGIGVVRDGTAADRFNAPESALVDIGEDADAATAAALGTAALAGWLPITWTAKLQPGETALVLGATGAAGSIAVQAARIAGAAKVVAVGRNPERLAALEAMADAVVSLEGDDLAGRLQAACGDGADVVFDALWGAPLEAALTATRLGARVVHIGDAAGGTATVVSGLVRGRQMTIKGYSNFGIPRDETVATYLTMVDLATAGDLTLPVTTTPLSEIASAWAGVASGGGKQVVVPG